MVTNEGENRPPQLSANEFIRALRGLYARVPHEVMSPAENLIENLTPEEREEKDAILHRRIYGEYGDRLYAKTQEVLDAAPYLSRRLRVFIQRGLNSALTYGVAPNKTEDKPLQKRYKELYEILINDLPLVEELEADEEILRQLEISCYRVKLAQHKADKEHFEERTKKRIPSPPEYFIRIYGETIEKREKVLEEWRSFILEKFEEDPEQPTQPPEQSSLT